MKRLILSALIGAGLFTPASTPSTQTVSGPYVHENLAIFLIHSPTTSNLKSYLTLKAAMDTKRVIVYETKNVNSLAIENVSTDPVFIQGGEIVKGGRQDRMIPNDFVLPPKSGRLPISSFCVEQGRWAQRGIESVHSFSVSTTMVPSKELKRAAMVDRNQLEVWQEVTKEQVGLAAAADRFSRTDGTHLGEARPGAEFDGLKSFSSLQTTLESQSVRHAFEPYITALITVIRGKRASGFAFAVNGRIQGADIYASPELFSRLWPKLLASSAVEAARLYGDVISPEVDTRTLEAFLHGSESQAPVTIDLANNMKLIRSEGSGTTMIESREGDHWIHRTFFGK